MNIKEKLTEVSKLGPDDSLTLIVLAKDWRELLLRVEALELAVKEPKP